MSPKLPPQITVKGGKDLDGTWGVTKTYTREFYFELINVQLQLFMMSSFIPAYNSLHPLYPFAIAKDSKCSANIELNLGGGNTGRGITISTNYQVLQPAAPLNQLTGFTTLDMIAGNMPFLLPAQDVSYEPVAVEETLDDLYIEKTAEEIMQEALQLGLPPAAMSLWKKAPFQTTAGTKLTGTRVRNILKMSFWYLADPFWFEEADLETAYTGVVNHAPVTIAGRYFPTGTAKIESIEIEDNTWERTGTEPYPMKMVRVSLLIDKKTWRKDYENVSSLFMAYPYVWQKANSGEKEHTKMKIHAGTNQPYYYFKEAAGGGQQTAAEEYDPSTESPGSGVEYKPSLQRIFCTMYDPSPQNEGTTDDPIYVQDPQKAIQFFGTREDCFRLNPDSEPTEVSEPMYLDKNGFILYPDPDTGKVDPALSPKITGYVFKPMDFTPLHFPIR
jgi:hypothetical protein